MKVAVSASGSTLDSEVDPRFGRCSLVLILDTDSMALEVLENPAVTAPGGAGIKAAEAVVERGVQVVITGDCGPNAHQVLSAAGIEIAVGASGTVRQAVEGYRQGRLKAAGAPSAPPGYGAGRGPRGGRGGRGSVGGGRGAGAGGRGGGRGRGRRAGGPARMGMVRNVGTVAWSSP